jgi:cation diffusion facilitator CzcD-associated flavoprotein CzcO
VLIVGAGPAGLASAAHLAQRNIPYVLIEAEPHVGARWRTHYDRLCLHTTKTHSTLPGLSFPREVGTYPSRSQVIAYLESYATKFGIQPRFGERLERARPSGAAAGTPDDAGWDIQTSSQRYRARHLIMAAGLNRTPVRPAWPRQELFRGRIVHSADYQSGATFSGQRVLVVGMGNTGAEIALDLHEHGARVCLSVRSPQNILPRDFLGTPVQVTSMRTAFLPVVVRDAMGRLTSRMAFGDLTPYGLPAPTYGPATEILKYGRTPVLDIGTVARIKAGDIEVVPAIETFSASGVTLRNGETRDVDVVVLATGYRSGLEELLDAPSTARNIHFVGYRNSLTGLLRQIGVEAEAVARAIASRAA